MPSVVVQISPFADSTSGEGRIFSRFFNEYRAVTTPTSGKDKANSAFLFRGGCPGLVDSGQKCRFHRHPTGLPRVDYCRRGEAPPSTGGPSQRLRAPATGGRTSNDQNRGQGPAVVKSATSRSEGFGRVADAQ